MAERLELSPLSLTLVCDQDSMYPEDGKTLRSTALEELTPSVTLTDGTVLSPLLCRLGQLVGLLDL